MTLFLGDQPVVRFPLSRHLIKSFVISAFSSNNSGEKISEGIHTIKVEYYNEKGIKLLWMKEKVNLIHWISLLIMV